MCNGNGRGSRLPGQKGMDFIKDRVGGVAVSRSQGEKWDLGTKKDNRKGNYLQGQRKTGSLSRLEGRIKGHSPGWRQTINHWRRLPGDQYTREKNEAYFTGWAKMPADSREKRSVPFGMHWSVSAAHSGGGLRLIRAAEARKRLKRPVGRDFSLLQKRERGPRRGCGQGTRGESSVTGERSVHWLRCGITLRQPEGGRTVRGREGKTKRPEAQGLGGKEEEGGMREEEAVFKIKKTKGRRWRKEKGRKVPAHREGRRRRGMLVRGRSEGGA